MTYEEIVSQSAQNDLDAAYEWLVAETPQHAPVWYNGILDAMASLRSEPNRCPIPPNQNAVPEVIRQMICGDKRHAQRVLFTVRENRVAILNIRHAAAAIELVTV